MEMANRLAAAATRALKNDIVVDALLVGSFAALGIRSFTQQRDIEALEAEKSGLVESNRATKKAMWDLKHQLYAEAEAASDSALVPLSRLKAVYGDVSAPSPQPGDSTNAKSKSSQPKFVV